MANYNDRKKRPPVGPGVDPFDIVKRQGLQDPRNRMFSAKPGPSPAPRPTPGTGMVPPVDPGTRGGGKGRQRPGGGGRDTTPHPYIGSGGDLPSGQQQWGPGWQSTSNYYIDMASGGTPASGGSNIWSDLAGAGGDISNMEDLYQWYINEWIVPGGGGYQGADAEYDFYDWFNNLRCICSYLPSLDEKMKKF